MFISSLDNNRKLIFFLLIQEIVVSSDQNVRMVEVDENVFDSERSVRNSQPNDYPVNLNKIYYFKF